MIAIVCFELLPEAFEMAGLTTGIAGIILGVVLVTIIDLLVPDRILPKGISATGAI